MRLIYNGHFVFTENTNSNINSTLSWVYQDNMGHWYTAHTWRAGSGISTGRYYLDDCWTSHGWLPNGSYDLSGVGHVSTFGSSRVHGMVWQLSNHWCHDGSVLRTDLFIHSKQNNSGGQTCPGDGTTCWVDQNSYQSEGCIKLSSLNNGWPNDIGTAQRPGDTQTADYISRSYGGPALGVTTFYNVLTVQ